MNKIIVSQKKSAFEIVTLLFLLTTMIIPSSYRFIRLIIIVVWLGICLTECECRIRVSSRIGIAFTVYIAVNMVCFAIGLMNGAVRGATALFRPYILWPIIFFAIVSRFNCEGRIALITRMMLGIECVICIIDIWYCFGKLGILPGIPPILDFITEDFRFNPLMTTLRFSTSHVSTHIFMIPFTIAIVWDDYYKKQHNWKLYGLLALELVSFYLSGRIALWISSIVALIGLLFIRINRYEEKRTATRMLKSMLFIMVMIVIVMFIASRYNQAALNAFEAIIDKIQNSFTTNDTPDGTRKVQMQYLTDGWLEHPLLGHGMGTNPEYVRDDVSTWSYEMTYHYILYSGGIIQLVALFGLFATILWTLWKAYKKKVLPYMYTIPCIIGLVAFIIATSVEPYMFKMGSMWITFIPMGIAVFGEKCMNYNMEDGLI